MCYCFIISNTTLGQTKTLPISNMILNFSKSEVKNTPMQSIDGFEVDAVVVNKDLFPFSEPKINLEYDKILFRLDNSGYLAINTIICENKTICIPDYCAVKDDIFESCPKCKKTSCK